ncbi:PREDICTED: tRNA (guanine(37)-N1)-methyltransferase-like [Priapulus caudatus]|uniref:tRNA (guanine(37)-N1)-methyltransferase n=1 Tax=Priapulus caudatus TaxID=37621 RepID=A0ABM1DUG2_PRICU|nr:PREDICTED: tRNA (guanine(37)-N1)-methyltransferase-like [Priapulus caudatus]
MTRSLASARIYCRALLPTACAELVHAGKAPCFARQEAKMSLAVSAGGFAPPADVRGMKELDRGAFSCDVKVPTVLVDNSCVGAAMKGLKKYFLRLPKVAPECSQVEADDTQKIGPCLLGAAIKAYLRTPEVAATPSPIETSGRRRAAAAAHVRQLVVPQLCRVLRAVLPPGEDSVSGYSRVGHILHLNLKEHLQPYKALIGQVLLDKHVGIRTVVNKTTSIDNTFRNFAMEVLAGDEDFITTVREHDVTYQMDFSKVYWNPRLDTEHQRIVAMLRDGDALYDVFAGVGPFAIPAAKKGVQVFANDLNAESHRWLTANAAANKVAPSVRTYNMDGREFVRTVVADDVARRLAADGATGRMHIVMNLPAAATEFLDCLRGLVAPPSGGSGRSLPTVHCYCFTKDAEDPESEVRRGWGGPVGRSLDEPAAVHRVRNVAPNKEMYCASFVIPEAVLFREDAAAAAVGGDDDGPRPKVPRID